MGFIGYCYKSPSNLIIIWFHQIIQLAKNANTSSMGVLGAISSLGIICSFFMKETLGTKPLLEISELA